MKPAAGERTKTIMQVVAIVVMALMVGTIAHKGYGDIARLADLYDGAEFWRRLGRYFLKNLAGGAG